MKPLLNLLYGMVSLLAIMPITAFACPILQDPSLTLLGTESYNIALQTTPEEIVVGEPFAVDLRICHKSGSPFDGDVRVNATMPLHKHGMNYEPSIIASDMGAYHMDGFVFHMQGNWQFLVALRKDGQTETVSLDHILE
ncbi:FixH family protein [Sneathiella marina]|uniref:FixH family protein n=1 Tax=Sneathiella marina TaxID=2950108 RepID=A0ABY4W346_9PROT|nr:FixH family protein [Sneathiella marina]USG61617.1 FixH family protein [Sneathiella marina]